MRVVMISKALLVGSYQRKAEEIARQGVDLTVLVPPTWRDRRGCQRAERGYTRGYELRTIPLLGNGSYHLHFYPTLGWELQRLRPDVVHVDEEPYNLATWLGIRAARGVGAAATFFSWQNLCRRYPPPFRWMERANYRACPIVIAGNQEAAAVLRRKGYTGDVRVIPQFGVDPQIFAPGEGKRQAANGKKSRSDEPFHVGYAGGLIPEKGVDLLLQACAQLQGEWRLSIVGSGEEEGALQALAHTLGVAGRVDLGRKVSSQAMPTFYRSLDALVLPSRTRPNWKEQFGRVLIEAMACGVPVVGSDSGEIPNVIDDAGLVFAEEDVEGLRRHLQCLLDDAQLRQQLARKGRQRVLAHYTMPHIAQQTVNVYRRLALEWKK